MSSTQVPDGYKQTEVGVIPEDWEVVLLDSVTKRGSGHTPDKKHPEYWNGNIKWISLKDSDRLDNFYIYDTFDKTTSSGIANSSAMIHPLGTVVLSRDAGVGKSAIMGDEMAVSQHFMAWCCSPELNNHLLYYWLQPLVVQKTLRRLKALEEGHFVEFNTSAHGSSFLERGTSRRGIGSWQAWQRR